MRSSSALTTTSALVAEKGAVRLINDMPLPPLEDGEVTVRLRKALLTATDVQLASGWLGFAGPIGTKFVGIVQTNGPLNGKRVIGSHVHACGKCDMCMSGVSQHCRSRDAFGIQKGGRGCIATMFNWPARLLHEVSDEVDDEVAVFAMEIGAAIQCASQLSIVNRPFITVLGDNLQALLIAQVMMKLNATVRWLGTNQNAMSVCEKWGIKYRPLSEVGRRADQDIVVDASNSTAGFQTAMTLVRPRGRILLKSMGPIGLEGCDLSALTMNEIELHGSFTGSVPYGLDALGRGEVTLEGLTSKKAGLSQVVNGLKGLMAGTALAVLVEP